MTDVLITAGELADLLKREPCVIIDTRNPEAYGSGHIPDAVNVHEIFTYLATSTPEGMHELKTKFPKQTDATVLSEPNTAYDTLVQVMDSVRAGHTIENHQIVRTELFPQISIGDAPVIHPTVAVTAKR